MDVVRTYEQIQKQSRGGGKISFGELMKKNYNYMSREGLQNVLLTLLDSQAITEETKNLGGIYTRWYRSTNSDFLQTTKSNRPGRGWDD